MNRREPPYPTPTGILIGGAYIPPPPRMSADAERIQALVLGSYKPRRTVWPWVALCAAMAAVLLTLMGCSADEAALAEIEACETAGLKAAWVQDVSFITHYSVICVPKGAK